MLLSRAPWRRCETEGSTDVSERDGVQAEMNRARRGPLTTVDYLEDASFTLDCSIGSPIEKAAHVPPVAGELILRQ
jgi:hypothetical protein